ncbi:MAG: class II aldolase/adducin family protein [Opitutaceae bacterium]|nr:class II aldolase/adducin family protein [Opitutaceae bacterium]
MSTTATDQLISLSHNLGQESRRLAILGEGNASIRVDQDTFVVKASGSSLASLDAAGMVECRFEPLLKFMDEGGSCPTAADEVLFGSRTNEKARKPSVEALFHAWLLTLPGVNCVGHTHPVSVNQVLCSPLAGAFATRRLFPDEIVCCGVESVLVDYTDPGLELARAIRRGVEGYREKRGGSLPRLILLRNHGLIALGSAPSAVLVATLMAEKAAAIFVGAAALGGPTFLTDEEVSQIAGRADEHYRQRALGL